MVHVSCLWLMLHDWQTCNHEFVHCNPSISMSGKSSPHRKLQHSWLPWCYEANVIKGQHLLCCCGVPATAACGWLTASNKVWPVVPLQHTGQQCFLLPDLPNPHCRASSILSGESRPQNKLQSCCTRCALALCCMWMAGSICAGLYCMDATGIQKHFQAHCS